MFEATVDMILKLIPTVLSLLILKAYYDIFFEVRRVSFQTFTIWFLFFIWQYCRAAKILFPSYINLFTNIVLICLINIIGYEGKNYLQKIVFSLLITAMWMLMEFIVGYLFALVGWVYFIPLFLGSLISEILILGLIFILKRFFDNENIRSLPLKYNVAFIMIPVGSMYVLYNVFMLSNACRIYGTYIIQCLLSTVIILSINVIVFKVYSSLAREKEILRCNTVYEQHLELCKQHMKEKELLLEEFRKERHNFKQHVSVLNNLLSYGKVEDTLEYLNKQTEQKLRDKVSICNTENVVVDALVNFKYSVAYNKGIELIVKVQVPIQLPFSNGDLCILLGNILDNAIECVDLMPKEKKNIQFYGSSWVIVGKNYPQTQYLC